MVTIDSHGGWELKLDMVEIAQSTHPAPASTAARYIAAAKSCGFKVIGYCFVTQRDDALVRNAKRPEADKVPDVAILSAYAKLEYPEMDEGFDELHFVHLTDNGFSVEDCHEGK